MSPLSGSAAPGLLHRLRRADQRAVDRVAGTRSILLDRALPRLGEAANYSRLWLAVAVVLMLTGSRSARRGAVQGLLSVTLASATTNVLAKGLARRSRPDAQDLPAMRRLRRAPVTTSFPSGHAASAAAFAVGVAMEAPALAVPLGGLAAGVAVSRVAVGVHYPSDVAAGAIVGVAAAFLTRRWWPVMAVRLRRVATG
jgi:membrane-associated phospholipid phosphatase